MPLRAAFRPRPILLVLLLVAVAGIVAVRAASPASAADPGQLQSQISAGRGKVSQIEGALRLTGAQLATLNGSIAGLQRRIAAIQATLDQDRARLVALRGQLARARTRLAALEQFQARAEQVLSAQLINSYETDRPDLISVVLEARGFSDLLERLSFAKTIRRQDVAITTRVRRARRAVAAQAIALGSLEVRQQALAARVLASRNALDRSRITLVSQQLRIAGAHAAQSRRLGAARAQVSALQGQLAQLQAAAARAAAQAAAPVASPAVPAFSAPLSSSQVVSGGGFTFPLPKGAASPPGTWSEDQGVDISAPGDTPEFAVCSGTIVQHGIGGFGPWAPILHCDSPVGGYQYVYYGHAGPNGQLPVGTHVGAGQVMSSVGPGIVGISTGPHLEIGFAGSDGAPIGGGSAGTMMSLLQGSY